MRSRPDALFLNNPPVIVSFDAVAAAFNEYFSGRDYWRKPLRATQPFFKAKPTRHARDLMVKENNSRTRVEEAIKNSFILNNWSCHFKRTKKCVCAFFSFFLAAFLRNSRGQGRVSEQTTIRSNSGEK